MNTITEIYHLLLTVQDRLFYRPSLRCIHQHCRSCLPADPARADKYFVYERQQSHPSCAPIHCSRDFFFMYLIQSLCKHYVSYQGHMMGACMERDMRRQLFDHYEKLSFSYYSKNNSGQMMSKHRLPFCLTLPNLHITDLRTFLFLS